MRNHPQQYSGGTNIKLTVVYSFRQRTNEFAIPHILHAVRTAGALPAEFRKFLRHIYLTGYTYTPLPWGLKRVAGHQLRGCARSNRTPWVYLGSNQLKLSHDRAVLAAYESFEMRRFCVTPSRLESQLSSFTHLITERAACGQE